MPIMYIRGHAYSRRQDAKLRHLLTDIDTRSRRALCNRCGLVSIKRDQCRKSEWKCCRAVNPEHRLAEINTTTKRAWCLGCLAEVDIQLINEARGRWGCVPNKRAQAQRDRIKHGDKRNAATGKWREKNPGYERTNRLKVRYGITDADYDTKFAAQNGVCRICGGPPDRFGRLHIDHCHGSGTVRDLLCNRCNRTLGLVDEDVQVLQAMIDYLTRWQEASVR